MLPHLERIQAWGSEYSAYGLTHGGLLTTAFTYLQNQWSKLVRFVENPRLRIDNNLAERHVRPIAVGRRTWLFCHSPAGGKAAVAWCPIVETAKANGIEPYWYLRYLFEQVPLCLQDERSVDQLLPWNLSPEQIMPECARG